MLRSTMLRSASRLETNAPIETQLFDRPSIKAQVATWLKRFWQFSNFYGEYNSLPPSARRRYVEQLRAQHRSQS